MAKLNPATSKIIKQLEKEGFVNVRICPMPPNLDMESHIHDEHTVHVILDGELTITDSTGESIYGKGDRIEFPAGTEHKARGNIDNGTMIVGEKKIAKIKKKVK